MTPFQWSKHVMVVDAAYADKVAFDLIVNFERMLGRPIPPADLARWVDCLALDGGIREGKNDIQVVMVHDSRFRQMDNFQPAGLYTELNGKAFSDHLGEFSFHTLTGEDLADKDSVLIDLVRNIMAEPKVERLMVVPDGENPALMQQLRQTAQQAHEQLHTTVFTMEPVQGGNFRQEMLGYSLLNALGIAADEINSKMK